MLQTTSVALGEMAGTVKTGQMIQEAKRWKVITSLLFLVAVTVVAVALSRANAMDARLSHLEDVVNELRFLQSDAESDASESDLVNATDVAADAKAATVINAGLLAEYKELIEALSSKLSDQQYKVDALGTAVDNTVIEFGAKLTAVMDEMGTSTAADKAELDAAIAALGTSILKIKHPRTAIAWVDKDVKSARTFCCGMSLCWLRAWRGCIVGVVLSSVCPGLVVRRTRRVTGDALLSVRRLIT
jgi:Tfp pilus assembly protein PilX